MIEGRRRELCPGCQGWEGKLVDHQFRRNFLLLNFLMECFQLNLFCIKSASADASD
jgi:hypothetical protein